MSLAFGDSPAYLTLFQVLTTPRLGTESNELGGDPHTAHFTFDITGAADELWSAWTEGISHRIPDHARLLLDLLLGQLQRAGQLATAVGNAEGFYRRITNWRPRIASRDRTHYHGHYADVLVDMLVELVTYLARTSGGLSESDFAHLLGSDNRVFRRLGVHALAMSTELTPAVKLAALESRLGTWPERSAERREGAGAFTNPSQATVDALAAVPVSPTDWAKFGANRALGNGNLASPTIDALSQSNDLLSSRSFGDAASAGYSLSKTLISLTTSSPASSGVHATPALPIEPGKVKLSPYPVSAPRLRTPATDTFNLDAAVNQLNQLDIRNRNIQADQASQIGGWQGAVWSALASNNYKKLAGLYQLRQSQDEAKAERGN